MRILINCSNLKKGGGLQVADSVCSQLANYHEHQFVVILSSALEGTKRALQDTLNVEIVTYDIPNKISTILTGRDSFLDRIVEEKGIAAVLTIFGPSRWQPRVPHLCGFARAQLVIKDSPYQERLSLKEKVLYRIWTWLFRKSSDTFYTENSYISKMLPDVLGKVKVFTVTNYYNQVFDHPEQWKRSKTLPVFSGTTLLSITAAYPHKNLQIMLPVAEYLERHYPDFQFRFVLTIEEKDFPVVPEHLKKHFLFIGKVDVAECPYLYEQADIMLMPTLLECFTATYPEAMRMEAPIVTTDLEFARGLCGDAACYYSAVDAEACAEAIYKVASDKEYAAKLVANGKRQLRAYDNYEKRADKLVRILEEIAVGGNGPNI